MVFDEGIVIRASIGNRIFAGQLIACRFGPNQLDSLVCISHTLDKLIVHETSTAIKLTANGEASSTKDKIANPNSTEQDDDNQDQSSSLFITFNSLDSEQAVYFITIKDVIKSLAVKRGSRNDSMEMNKQNLNKDFLLIGCTSSIFIYDTLTQTNLISISAATPINYMVNREDLTICGGGKKIYALKFEQNGNDFLFENYGSNRLNAEIISERSTGDSINCLIQGHFDGKDLIVTGSREDQKMRIYYLDSFDFNIQACQLNIDENSPVNCLCAINTVESSPSDGDFSLERTGLELSQQRQLKQDKSHTLLPSFDGQSMENFQNLHTKNQQQQFPSSLLREQMRYFAFGLENGSIGVRRLVMISSDMSRVQGFAPLADIASPSLASTNRSKTIRTERMWRHKAKQQPLMMLLYDINGDGLDELLIGYRNGRLEARSPFTGQLLAVTRCFKARERLAGLAILMGNSFKTTPPMASTVNNEQQVHRSHGKIATTNEALGILVACSTSGSLIGFKPQHITGVRQPLRGFNFSDGGHRASVGGNRQLFADLQAEDWTTSLKADLTSKVAAAAALTMDNDDQRSSSPPHSALSSSTSSPVSDDNSKRQGTNSALAGGTDLHIELRGDDTMAGQCEAKQGADLLHRLSGLRNEQIELERRACQIYNATMHHVVSSITSQQLDESQTALTGGLMMANNVSISHSWDFDATTTSLQTNDNYLINPVYLYVRNHRCHKRALKLKLRLFIVVASKLDEQVDMLELEDESRNFLPNGLLVVSSPNCGGVGESRTSDQLSNSNSDHSTNGNLIAIVLLRSKQDQETQLNLRIFCSLKNRSLQPSDSSADRYPRRHSSLRGSRERLVARMYETSIQVPKFAMFALASPSKLGSTEDSMDSSRMIKMTFKLDDNDSTRLQQQQVLDYLNENFLCLRFGLPTASVGRSGSTSSSSPPIRVDQHRLSATSWLSNISSSRASTTASIQEENLNSILTMRRSTLGTDADQVAGTLPPRQVDGSQPEDEVEIELRFVDIRQTIRNRQQQLATEAATGNDKTTTTTLKTNTPATTIDSSSTNETVTNPLAATKKNNSYKLARKQPLTLPVARDGSNGNQAGQDASMLRVALSNGRLELECENSDLLVNLVRFLVIDRLQLRFSSGSGEAELDSGSAIGGQVGKNFEAKLGPILHELNAISRVRELEESEKRIQSELYESADYTRNLMQQFAIANQLNEFSIAKELLNELSMMLSGALNAAQAHYLNNKKRHELKREMDQLREKISFLTGQSN